METSITPGQFQGCIIKAREVCGLRLVEGVYSANSKVPKHSHQYGIFCIALKGTCNEVYAGKLRQYEPLAVEFLPPNQSHSLVFSTVGTRAFSMDVAAEWMEKARDYSLKLDNSVFCRRGPLSNLFMKLYQEFLVGDEASYLAIEGLTLEMLAEASRHQVDKPYRTPRWLARAEELLHERFSEPLTITQLASAVGVHPVHLAREFRRRHRCTPGEYLRHLRVEQACRELRGSKETLAAIASSAGFSDQSHFSRIFKRHMGMTPAEYRTIFAGH
jgi:AraC family transcriptional regulator